MSTNNNNDTLGNKIKGLTDGRDDPNRVRSIAPNALEGRDDPIAALRPRR